MSGFGQVDFVIADIDESGEVKQFLSVELQAIDITGSVMPAYRAWRRGRTLARRPTYGLNWDNVYKSYITQLIRKGYFHRHWGTKIVAVIQDEVYRYIGDRFEFMRTSDVNHKTVNVIFMAYRFEPDLDRPGSLRLVLDTVEGTSHASLQNAVLYIGTALARCFLQPCQARPRASQRHITGKGRVDRISPALRSRNMRAIRSKDMKPELAVRRLVHSMGYRYRLHRHGLPGRPDLVFSGRRKVIFVHGCFWRQHRRCRLAHVPRSNLDYWQPKLARTKGRDKKTRAALKASGWDVLVIWECEVSADATLAVRVRNFLEC